MTSEESSREIPPEDEWEFSSGDIIRVAEDQRTPSGKSEYRIKWLLVRESNSKRCYHVETEENGTHLFTAPTVEGRYEVITPEESRVFDEDGEDSLGLNL